MNVENNSVLNPLYIYIVRGTFFPVNFELQPKIASHRLPTHRRGAHGKFFQWILFLTVKVIIYGLDIKNTRGISQCDCTLISRYFNKQNWRKMFNETRTNHRDWKTSILEHADQIWLKFKHKAKVEQNSAETSLVW